MDLQPVSLRDFVIYFLKLGAYGFGGPIALVGYMQRDLVEQRRWIAEEDFKQGLALSQLAPGPLAAQLAMYLGWVRAGTRGATVVGIAFVLPSLFMVLVLAALYIRFGGLPWMQGMFYGIAAAVIAIIARSAWKLIKITLTRDPLLWAIFAVSAVVTAWTESEVVWLFLASGAVALVVRVLRPRLATAALLVLIPPWLVTGLHGPAGGATLRKIATYFTEAGAFVFGSGLAIVPFLYGGVVEQYHWLTERQFIDAVAVAMITPGPVVITVAFIGHLTAGPVGALVAAAGVFLPTYLFVVIPARHFHRFARNFAINAFVAGVTAAATGAIAGAAVVLGKRAIIDVPTLVIASVSLAVLVAVKKLPEPALIAVAGIVGLLLH